MLQSSDLVRISTVQSTDFIGQSSDLAQGIYFIKSSSRSEEFIFFVWVSVWHLDRLPFTQSLLIVPLSLQMVFLRPFRTQIWTDWCGRGSVCQINFLFSILFIWSWNPHVCGEILRFLSKSLGKSSDCVDFTKSMDLSDLSECLQFFNSQFWFIINLNYQSKFKFQSGDLDFWS